MVIDTMNTVMLVNAYCVAVDESLPVVLDAGTVHCSFAFDRVSFDCILAMVLHDAEYDAVFDAASDAVYDAAYDAVYDTVS